jgi:hypothetical protein
MPLFCCSESDFHPVLVSKGLIVYITRLHSHVQEEKDVIAFVLK